jgi:ribonuclease-3
MDSISKLEQLFKNKDLFTLALTHKSWVNEHQGTIRSNERLEFLGDAILEFIVSKELYLKLPDKEEGYLTALRANLVNTKNLADLAGRLGIGAVIRLSKGEEDGGGRTNPSLLADTMEAIIGALYLDQGLEATYNFVNLNLISQVPEKINQPLKDPKSLLQEHVQAGGSSSPKYKVIEESGPDHNKKFVIEVYVDNKVCGVGEGKSKSQAEQAAASDALKKFNL